MNDYRKRVVNLDQYDRNTIKIFCHAHYLPLIRTLVGGKAPYLAYREYPVFLSPFSFYSTYGMIVLEHNIYRDLPD